MSGHEGDEIRLSRYESELSDMVAYVLEASGIGSRFDAAVANLRGEGLETTPTTLEFARYGAAVTVLEMGKP